MMEQKEISSSEANEIYVRLHDTVRAAIVAKIKEKNALGFTSPFYTARDKYLIIEIEYDTAAGALVIMNNECEKTCVWSVYSKNFVLDDLIAILEKIET